MPVEEDLHAKLQALQDMFTSTRPISILYLRGDELDDPDLHPVTLSGEPLDLMKLESRDMTWQDRSAKDSLTGSSLASPSPSSLSLHSQVSAVQWQDLQQQQHGAAGPAIGGETAATSSGRPTRVGRSDDDGNLSGWIEALGVDPTYRPPTEMVPRPVACFYVLRRNNNHNNELASGLAGGVDGVGMPETREYHKAVYLARRTMGEFVGRVCAKLGLDAARVVRAAHVIDDGRLKVEMDEDVIRELAEGQDMILEVVEVAMKKDATAAGQAAGTNHLQDKQQQQQQQELQHHRQSELKEEWEMVVDLPPPTPSALLPGTTSSTTTTDPQRPFTIGYELRFTF
jgi:hypothetical protein